MEKFRTFFFYLTIFITGAVILMIEILGTRVLAPFYGSTIFVWSALISVTLGFLALGYWTGGKIADKYYSFSYFYLLILFSAVIFLTSLQYKKYIILLADKFGLQYGPLIAAILLFGPVFFLLGMVSPYAIRLLTKTIETTGRKSGAVFAFSTAGSLAGALAAGFLLVPILPVSSIFIIFSLVLIGISIAGLVLFKDWPQIQSLKTIVLFLIIILLFAVGFFVKNLDIPKMTLQEHGVFSAETVFEDNNFYGNYKVVGVPRALDGKLCFLIDGTNQGCIDPRARNDASPLSAVSTLFKLVPAGSRALVLGSGAGNFFYYWSRDDLHYDIVDINPSSKEVLDATGVSLNPEIHNLVINDARAYLKRTEKKYDIIWNDLLGNAVPVPHMMTRESYQLVKSHLKPQGIFVTNIIGSSNGKDPLVNNTAKTLKSVFPYVLASLGQPDKFYNYIIFLGSTYPFDKEAINQRIIKMGERNEWDAQEYTFFKPNFEGDIITDDFNPVEHLWAQHLKKYINLADFRIKFKRLTKEDFK